MYLLRDVVHGLWFGETLWTLNNIQNPDKAKVTVTFLGSSLLIFYIAPGPGWQTSWLNQTQSERDDRQMCKNKIIFTPYHFISFLKSPCSCLRFFLRTWKWTSSYHKKFTIWLIMSRHFVVLKTRSTDCRVHFTCCVYGPSMALKQIQVFNISSPPNLAGPTLWWIRFQF